ncbi:MAG: hypothetical protein ABSD67_11495 [Terracidiphilus sp.]|jgi:hypothetical protein
MHVHSAQMNMNSVNPYSAAAEKAIATQRAADVRKKLVKSAAALEGASSPEGDLMISQWMNADQSQAQGEGQNHAGVAGKDSDFR